MSVPRLRAGCVAGQRGSPTGLAAPTALRGPVFVTTSCALAIVAHVAGGGAAPDGPHVVVAVLVAALGWAPAADGWHRPVRAVLRVAGVQVGLHVVLGQSLDRAAAHVHGATGLPEQAMTGAAILPGPLMLAVHALAAALLAVWLLRGERAAWAAVVRALLLLVGAGPSWRPLIEARTRIEAQPARPYRRPALPAVGLRAPPLSA